MINLVLLKKTLLLCFIIGVSPLWSQDCDSYINYKKNHNALVCPEAMVRDLNYLHETILNTHPTPFGYCSKEEFDGAYNSALASVNSPKTVFEFAQIVASFVKVIRDSHTSFNPRDLLFLSGKKRKILPFYVMKFNERYYLSRIYMNEIPVGSELLFIGDMSIDSLYRLTRTFCPNEAKTESSTREIIPKMMGNVFNAQNHSADETLRFIYVDNKGDTVRRELSYIKLKQFDKKGKWYPSKEIEYEFIEDVGYLRIYSFESKNEKRFKKMINRFFKKVKESSCTEVVIDVRENRGGYVLLLEHLLSYINLEKKSYDLIYTYKRSDLDRFETLSRLKKMDFVKKAKRVYPRGMISKEYDFYKSSKGSVSSILYEKSLINSNESNFRGKCTLFINGLSMSASVLLASWFEETKRGDLIGSPCFGTVSGTNGNPATIFLKHSGLPVSISTLKLTPNAYQKTEVNDFSVKKSITISLENLKDGIDPFKKILIKD
jgi:hypothetical protein